MKQPEKKDQIKQRGKQMRLPNKLKNKLDKTNQIKQKEQTSR